MCFFGGGFWHAQAPVIHQGNFTFFSARKKKKPCFLGKFRRNMLRLIRSQEPGVVLVFGGGCSRVRSRDAPAGNPRFLWNDVVLAKI